jgi:hypothetical protein
VTGVDSNDVVAEDAERWMDGWLPAARMPMASYQVGTPMNHLAVRRLIGGRVLVILNEAGWLLDWTSRFHLPSSQPPVRSTGGLSMAEADHKLVKRKGQSHVAAQRRIVAGRREEDVA